MKLFWYTHLRPRLWRATMAADCRLTAAYRANQRWRHALAAVGLALLGACGSHIPLAAGQPRREGRRDFSHHSPVWRLVFNLEHALMERYSSRSYGGQALICTALALLSVAGFSVDHIPARKPGAR